jgi:hypothetical protein
MAWDLGTICGYMALSGQYITVTDQVAKPPLTRQGPIRGPGRIPGALHRCVGLLRVESIGGDRGRD